MSLRRRILIGLMLLAGVGLLVTDAALWFGLRSYLVDQVDNQLVSLIHSPQAGSVCGFNFGSGGSGSSSPGLPGNSYVAFVVDGQIQCGSFLDSDVSSTAAAPKIPDSFGTGPGDAPLGTPFSASTGGPNPVPYRMYALPAAPHDDPTLQGTLVVGIPMTDVNATLGHLLAIELIATGAVLVTLAVASWTMIRLGLRPLDEMTETAGAIAAGDLSRRVPEGDANTEVGRLAAAMNIMLAQIETAFAARQRSESHLRRFVADASHELRTPLTSIRGYAELFRRGAARRPEDLETAMRRIEEEAARMGVLVDNLLQLARLDIAAVEDREPARERVDLAAVVADAVGDLRAVEPDRPIEVHADPAVVAGDEAELRQVAANLLNNALHHTPAGTLVTVSCGTVAGGAGAFLEVADQGPGMSEEQASHVFERFWRVDPARTRGHGGAGLGLAIVAAIVEAHGGQISLVTSPGAGARFRVDLPAAEGATQPDQAPSQDGHAKERSGPDSEVAPISVS